MNNYKEQLERFFGYYNPQHRNFSQIRADLLAVMGTPLEEDLPLTEPPYTLNEEQQRRLDLLEDYLSNCSASDFLSILSTSGIDERTADAPAEGEYKYFTLFHLLAEYQNHHVMEVITRALEAQKAKLPSNRPAEERDYKNRESVYIGTKGDLEDAVDLLHFIPRWMSNPRTDNPTIHYAERGFPIDMIPQKNAYPEFQALFEKTMSAKLDNPSLWDIARAAWKPANTPSKDGYYSSDLLNAQESNQIAFGKLVCAIKGDELSRKLAENLIQTFHCAISIKGGHNNLPGFYPTDALAWLHPRTFILTTTLLDRDGFKDLEDKDITSAAQALFDHSWPDIDNVASTWRTISKNINYIYNSLLYSTNEHSFWSGFQSIDLLEYFNFNLAGDDFIHAVLPLELDDDGYIKVAPQKSAESLPVGTYNHWLSLADDNRWAEEPLELLAIFDSLSKNRQESTFKYMKPEYKMALTTITAVPGVIQGPATQWSAIEAIDQQRSK